MATRKSTKKSSHSDGPKAVVVFWIIFVVVIISIAVFNWPTITRNFNLFTTRLTTSPATEAELLNDDEIDESTVDTVPSERIVPEVVIEPAARPQTTAPPEQPPAATPAPQTPAQTTQTVHQTTQPSASTQTSQQSAPQTAQPSTPTPPPVQTRDRAVYFAQVNNDGQILQSKVTRKIPVSETPLQDVINTMLAGPSAAEIRLNNLNLIPQNTRLLSATVRGSTAYLNFSEDFMFNTFGVEGYVAQLRQIVWTATEFPNIRDVQILIEGRRVDYLAEGIWIGSPIGRQ